MKFSLVIPCYNEAANLPQLIERCQDLIARPEIEVIIVDNGSTDDTADVLLKLLPHYHGFRSIRVERNQGYGFGVVSGLRVASGQILGWTHADMQTDPLDALCGLDLFEKYGENIFVKGRRKGRPFMDVVFTVGMSLFETFLLSKPMWDINAQPTMFPRKFFDAWDSPPDDFSLDLYAYYQAQSRGLNIRRFAVNFGERLHGVSHWNVNWTSKVKFIQRTVDFSLKLKKEISA